MEQTDPIHARCYRKKTLNLKQMKNISVMGEYKMPKANEKRGSLMERII